VLFLGHVFIIFHYFIKIMKNNENFSFCIYLLMVFGSLFVKNKLSLFSLFFIIFHYFTFLYSKIDALNDSTFASDNFHYFSLFFIISFLFEIMTPCRYPKSMH